MAGYRSDRIRSPLTPSKSITAKSVAVNYFRVGEDKEDHRRKKSKEVGHSSEHGEQAAGVYERTRSEIEEMVAASSKTPRVPKSLQPLQVEDLQNLTAERILGFNSACFGHVLAELDCQLQQQGLSETETTAERLRRLNLARDVGRVKGVILGILPLDDRATRIAYHQAKIEKDVLAIILSEDDEVRHRWERRFAEHADHYRGVICANYA